MKFFIPLLLLTFINLSCNEKNNSQCQEIAVQYDTLNIKLQGKIESIIEHNKQYYCIVEHPNPFSSLAFRRFYILSKDGTPEYCEKVPEKINRGPYNILFVRNDSILLREYFSQNIYYFNTTNLSWAEISEVDNIIFEDDSFKVYYLYFGEWGSTIWFKDKITKKEYELKSPFTNINKIDNIYYLTYMSSILKIINPRELKECDTMNYYQTVRDNASKYGSSSEQGIEYLYQDTSDWADSHNYIATSFTHNDSLYLLCSSGDSTFIGYLHNQNIVSLKKIDSYLEIYDKWHNVYQGNPLHSNEQLLYFSSRDRERNGIILIKSDTILVLDILNTYEERLIGKEKSKLFFESLTDLHLNEFNNLLPSKVDLLLRNIGGLDVSPNHKMYFNEFECSKAYQIREDTSIHLLVTYFSNKKQDSIKVISYEWKEFRKDNFDPLSEEIELSQINLFNKRLEEIRNYIIQKYGAPNKTKFGRNYRNEVWNTHKDFVITLSWVPFDGFREIKLDIQPS